MNTYIKSYIIIPVLLAFVSIICLSSCGGNDDNSEEPKILNRSVTVSANDLEVRFPLNHMKNGVETVLYDCDWIQYTISDSEYGYPVIILLLEKNTEANIDTDLRSCVMTINGKNGSIVYLEVNQKGASSDGSTDCFQQEESDQPAY